MINFLHKTIVWFWVVVALLFAVAVFTAPKTYAVDANPIKTGCDASGAASPICNDTATDPLTGNNGLIIKASRLVAVAVGVVSVIMIIIAGYTYVMSSGDPQKINAAKNTLLYAVIGLVIAAVAQFLVAFIVSKILT